jgi:hypothetical protein
MPTKSRSDKSTSKKAKSAHSNRSGAKSNAGADEGAKEWSRSRAPVDDNNDRDDRGRFGSQSKSTKHLGTSATSSPRRSQTGSRR